MRPACKTWLALLGLALFPLAGQASAQSQPAANDICPPRYSVFDSVCLNETTGDVVNQRSVQHNEARGTPQCPPAAMDASSSCVDPATTGTQDTASANLR